MRKRSHDFVSYQTGASSHTQKVGLCISNRPIAAIELENRPDRSAHLLALRVSRVTGNAQRTEPDKSRDDCVVSTGPALRLFLRHGTDPIAGKMRVNQSSDENPREPDAPLRR
jgi:hypothetical protein